MDFTKSTINSCLYLCNGLVFVFYVDDGIVVSLDNEKIQSVIAEFANGISTLTSKPTTQDTWASISLNNPTGPFSCRKRG